MGQSAEKKYDIIIQKYIFRNSETRNTISI